MDNIFHLLFFFIHLAGLILATIFIYERKHTESNDEISELILLNFLLLIPGNIPVLLFMFNSIDFPTSELWYGISIGLISFLYTKLIDRVHFLVFLCILAIVNSIPAYEFFKRFDGNGVSVSFLLLHYPIALINLIVILIGILLYHSRVFFFSLFTFSTLLILFHLILSKYIPLTALSELLSSALSLILTSMALIANRSYFYYLQNYNKFADYSKKLIFDYDKKTYEMKVFRKIFFWITFMIFINGITILYYKTRLELGIILASSLFFLSILIRLFLYYKTIINYFQEIKDILLYLEFDSNHSITSVKEEGIHLILKRRDIKLASVILKYYQNQKLNLLVVSSIIGKNPDELSDWEWKQIELNYHFYLSGAVSTNCDVRDIVKFAFFGENRTDLYYTIEASEAYRYLRNLSKFFTIINDMYLESVFRLFGRKYLLDDSYLNLDLKEFKEFYRKNQLPEDPYLLNSPDYSESVQKESFSLRNYDLKTNLLFFKDPSCHDYYYEVFYKNIFKNIFSFALNKLSVRQMKEILYNPKESDLSSLSVNYNKIKEYLQELAKYDEKEPEIQNLLIILDRILFEEPTGTLLKFFLCTVHINSIKLFLKRLYEYNTEKYLDFEKRFYNKFNISINSTNPDFITRHLELCLTKSTPERK